MSGTHSRHLFVHSKIMNMGHECSAIVMEREEIIPKINLENSEYLKSDIDNFNIHFQKRYEIENKTYGDLNYKKIYEKIDYHYCSKDAFNDNLCKNFIKKFDADICIVFGAGILSREVIELLPSDTINLHLGLSPYYKGSATLFWPFYNLEPQFAGITIHKVIDRVDAGGILHQSVPDLNYDDGIHDVASNAVIKSIDELIEIIENRKNNKWQYSNQIGNGKLYLTRDFHPSHLRMIYDIYDDKIVNAFLDKKLNKNKPKIISYFKK